MSDEKIKFEKQPSIEKLASKNNNLGRIIKIFKELSAIPRPSKGEEKVADYIFNTGKKLGYKSKKDKHNNVLIEIPATKGYEKNDGVIFQGHSDMICVSLDEKKNPAKVGVAPLLDKLGKWIIANGTTLGADNGVGVATILALAQDKSYKHGPLALLVTTDEETGLNGANNLRFDLKKYKYLINVDSEDWGEATIGCAGGEDAIIKIKLEKEPVRLDKTIEVRVDGIKGGHSAMAITKIGRANAIKVLAGILSDLSDEVGIRIVEINGGTLRNVIPSGATAKVVYSAKDTKDEKVIIDKIAKRYKKELTSEDGIKVVVKDVVDQGQAFSTKDTEKLLDLIDDMPHGVYKWADGAETVPQTSTNLAIIKTENGDVKISNMSRSSIETELDDMNEKIKEVVENHQASVKTEGRYPGWEPDEKSKILALTKELYSNEFRSDMRVVQTHGGLECGIILSKYPHLEAISIGPTIEGAHGVEERAELESIEKFYRLLKLLATKLAS